MALTETDCANIAQEIIKLLAARGLTLGEAEKVINESRSYIAQPIVATTNKQRDSLLSKFISCGGKSMFSKALGNNASGFYFSDVLFLS